MSRWNREAALLGIPDLPEEAFKHVGDGKIKPQGGGGGGGHTTATTTTSNVPEYASGAFMEMIGRGAALAEAPYQAYGGERVAQFTPMQQQAFQGMTGQQVAGQVGLGSGLAALSGVSSFTQPGTAVQFMSPFMEQALAPQLRELSRQAAIQGTQQQAEAVSRGAFGGSRDAIMRAERERNLMQQQGDVLARGYQTAFEQAQNQFNQEQANRLQAAAALGQLGQTQFGQQMDIIGGQQKMGAEQQALGQRILDQQYADFQQQRDFPYQQIGFMSDLLRGTGSSTRQIYSTPQPSGLQTLTGLGSALYGASRMADGGEVKEYAVGGGITGLLSDDQLKQPRSPMMDMAAQEELVDRARVRQAAALQQPDDTPPTPEELVQIRDMALAEGDLETAQEAQAMLDQMGAGVAALGEPDITEGGIAMASGGPVSFAEGQTVRTPLDRQREADREALKRFGIGALETVDDIGRAGMDVMSLPLRAVAGIHDSVLRRPLRAAGMDLDYLSPRLVPEGVDPTSMTPYTDSKRLRTGKPKSTEEMPTDTPTMPGRSTGVGGPTAEQMQQFHAAQAKVPPTPDPTKEGLGALAAGPGAAATSSGAPRTAGGLSIAQIIAARKQAGYDSEAQRKQLTGGLADWFAAEREAAEGDITDLDALRKAMGVHGEEREARAKEGLAGLEGEKEQAKAMAFLQAGFAILGADSTKGAWNAIGQGALAGLGAYKGDMKDLGVKRERLLKDLDAISDLRRQEDMAFGEKKLELQGRRRKVEVDAKKANFEMLKNLGDIDRQTADAITEQYIKSRDEALDRQSRERIASSQVKSVEQRNRLDALFNSQTRMLEYAERVKVNALKPYESFLKKFEENQAMGLPPTPQQLSRYNQIMEQVEQQINSTLGPQYQQQLQTLQQQIDAVAGVQTPRAPSTQGFRVLGPE